METRDQVETIHGDDSNHEIDYLNVLRLISFFPHQGWPMYGWKLNNKEQQFTFINLR